MKMAKQIKLPTLPHGEGVFSISKNGKVRLRKIVSYGNETKRLSVTADTPSECMKKMREKERKSRIEIDNKTKFVTLYEAMIDWFNHTKLGSVKSRSSDRIETTINHQIKGYPLGQLRLSEIDDKDINSHLDTLVDENYSYSTIKKTYDVLNEFFRYKCLKEQLKTRDMVFNPMMLVNIPSKNSVKKKTKEIQYMKPLEIAKFEKAATAKYKNGKRIYPTGNIYIFLIYTGLRVGEICALKWEDVDFNNRRILIAHSLSKIKNRNKSSNSDTNFVYVIESTKNEHNRFVPLNEQAYQALFSYYKDNGCPNKNEFVLKTKNNEFSVPENLSKTLYLIEKRAGLQLMGMHSLRHTCASLLFKQKIQVEIIASILGNSPEVCRTTYIHFIEEQKADSINQIPNFTNIAITDFDTILNK